MSNTPLNALSQAILHTVTYSDIFDYPLIAPEIHRYLMGVTASLEEVQQALENDQHLAQTEIYFTLPGRTEIVKTRKERAARSKQLLPVALKYGRVLGSFPFVRMVALTGSLAVGNPSSEADFDYMLVTAPGRLWTARAFAVTFGRIMRPFGHVICVNLLVSERALAWDRHDLYTARELCQMIPVTGSDVHQRLMAANRWAEEFLPNAYLESNSLLLGRVQKQTSALQNLLELPLRGRLGDQLEKWLMKLQLKRIARRPGAGEETVFTADVCQGNFDHHGKQTREAFEEKLRALTGNPALSGVNDRGQRRNASIEAMPSPEEIASSPIGPSQ